jgi:c-di-GMP-binding flagellar brake protein YcgR
MIDRESVEEELAIGDRVLAEVDIYGRTVSFRTVIVKICPDELWLGMASPDHRLDGLRENHTLQLTVARAGAALLGQSGFLRPLGGGKSRVFAVVRPGFLERVQRRAHLRYQIDVPINFRHLDPASREPRGKAASGVTLNVSPGGLLFQTDAAPQLGEELDLTLPLSGGDRVSMIGLVTRLRGVDEAVATPEENSAKTEVAVRFTRITAVDQDRLVRFILMTDHRRREAALRQPPAVPVSAPVPASSGKPIPFVPPVAAAPPAPAVGPRQVVVPPAPAAPAVEPDPIASLEIDPNLPPIAVGLQLCAAGDSKVVRAWFDKLDPFSRIELLSMLQANMAGTAVAGAAEPASVRPLAVALGLLGS